MKDSLVSIVIPVYNSERYLEECLNAIINQTYTSIELIIINDGSNDNSNKIIEKYKNQDKRITVYNQQNKGVGEARNTGLKNFKGDYILFVDSDDFLIDKNSIQTMVDQIKDNDILGFNNILINKKTIKTEKIINECYNTGKEFIEETLKNNGTFGWYLWKYIYKKDVWKDITFPNLSSFEDMSTLYKVFLNSKKITIIDKPLYAYRINENGTSRIIDYNLCETMIKSINKSINNVQSMNLEDNIKDLLSNNFAFGYFSVINAINFVEKNRKEEIIKLLKNNKTILKYCKYGKAKIAKSILSLIGIKAFAFLLNIK